MIAILPEAYGFCLEKYRRAIQQSPIGIGILKGLSIKLPILAIASNMCGKKNACL
jgi:hypothetical protein